MFCGRVYGDTRRYSEHFKLRKNTACLRWQRSGLSGTGRRQNNDLNPSIGGRRRLESVGSVAESASDVVESGMEVAESPPAEDEDSDTVLATKRFVVFRLFPDYSCTTCHYNFGAVSYTHMTLPTIYSLQHSVPALSSKLILSHSSP